MKPRNKGNVTALPVRSAGEFEIDDDYVQIPPGRYDVVLVSWFTCLLFKGRSAKLALNFRVVTFGESFGVVLRRWYHVRKILGKPGHNGRFRVGRGSDFMHDYARLVGMVSRNDRFALSRLKNVQISAEVETVTKDYDQRDIPGALRYSVIRELIGVTAGNVEADHRDCA